MNANIFLHLKVKQCFVCFDFFLLKHQVAITVKCLSLPTSARKQSFWSTWPSAESTSVRWPRKPRTRSAEPTRSTTTSQCCKTSSVQRWVRDAAETGGITFHIVSWKIGFPFKKFQWIIIAKVSAWRCWCKLTRITLPCKEWAPLGFYRSHTNHV